MAYEVIVDNINREEWDKHANNFADYSIYQTWAYQQVRAEMAGQQVSRILVRDRRNNIQMMCQIRIQRLKPLGLKIGYVQWGPLVCARKETLKCSIRALEALRETYLGSKVKVLRVVPNAEANRIGNEFAAMLKSAGFEYVSSAKPHLTMMVSVDDPEEQIRGRLHRSWRRGLLKAEQNGLEIKEGTDNKYFEVLEKMYLCAKRRKGFKGLDPQEFVRVQYSLSEKEKMNVVTAYCDGEPVASHASSHLGETALGTLAACNEKGLECSASYLVWWRTFLAAKRAGMKRYDLGGINPAKNPTVYQFKQRMGAQEIRYIGEYEIYTCSAVKQLWRLADKARSVVKG